MVYLSEIFSLTKPTYSEKSKGYIFTAINQVPIQYFGADCIVYYTSYQLCTTTNFARHC